MTDHSVLRNSQIQNITVRPKQSDGFLYCNKGTANLLHIWYNICNYLISWKVREAVWNLPDNAAAKVIVEDDRYVLA
ncbi:hypothetical protein [[Clostridium] hylemonae]|uniref:Uncharacterized protein n=1 Tax=[Clostridium] hylemonae DSM 15053 TaxID=553973 RepID=C0BVU6_9FIRM|nr:hypothetical protein [[Clostridium] hylemonae]EEG75925.1 hypothetical protein CLOHYLEM_03901 [[Clostridium] hylemonae DSM 15053]